MLSQNVLASSRLVLSRFDRFACHLSDAFIACVSNEIGTRSNFLQYSYSSSVFSNVCLLDSTRGRSDLHFADTCRFRRVRRRMAEALPSSFDEWIRSMLNELQSNNDDMSDFVQYLLGIVTSDSETDEEKLTAISELLADLDFKVTLASLRQTHSPLPLRSTLTTSASSASRSSTDGTSRRTIASITRTPLAIE